MKKRQIQTTGKPVVFTEQAYAALSARFEPARAGGRETTAYLLGRSYGSHVEVTAIVVPGRPHESAAMTHADYAAADRDLAAAIAAGYEVLGEAHLHLGMAGPSGGDLASLERVRASHPGYLCVVQTRYWAGQAPTVTATSLDNDGKRVDHPVRITEDVPAYRPFIPAERRAVRIVQFGLGSGGINTAVQLAKLGVQEVWFVDSDTFEARNLNRHLASAKAVGKTKAGWVAQFLAPRSGATKIHGVVVEVSPATQESWLSLLRRADVIVQATGHPVVAAILSQAARELGKVIIHAGSYEGGRGGFVFVQGHAASDPCYCCVSGIGPTVADDTASLAELERTYGLSAEELHAQVGLWTDVNVVAAIHAKAVLDVVKHGDVVSRPNFFTIDNQTITVTSERVAQRPTCARCFPPADISEADAREAVAGIPTKEA